MARKRFNQEAIELQGQVTDSSVNQQKRPLGGGAEPKASRASTCGEREVIPRLLLGMADCLD